MSETLDVTPQPGRMSRKERGKLRRVMRDLVMFLPNLLKLLVRLVKDARVSRADKIILGGTILYVITPLDFLPDMIPIIGQIDDSYLVAISLLRLLNRADDRLIADYWDGDMNIKKLLNSIVDVATFFLPKHVRNALTARIDVREPRQLRAIPGGQDQKQGAK